MPSKKKKHPKEKGALHPRNKHHGRYNFKELAATCSELTSFIKINDYGDESIDFFNPEAVKILNKALLKHFYDINYWSIPSGYLCPPIPGRADYIHYIADLLNHQNKIPKGAKIQCLDIGVGANCIYPIIGTKEYGWSFIGADIDPISITSATKIIESNASLKGKVELRLQSNPKAIFENIIQENEFIDVSICNPPFHASAQEAQTEARRKVSNLKGKAISKPILNFGGQQGELWCEGGEEAFVQNMVDQSRQFSTSCFWFSTLVSKEAHLKKIYNHLKKGKTTDVRTIEMKQGNKLSRIVAWTFLTPKQQKSWANARWGK